MPAVCTSSLLQVTGFFKMGRLWYNLLVNIFENLNPEQKKAITFGEGPLLIVAGAGTGKTTVITQRVAWLIQQKKARPDEILAITFTDKAAGELEERIDQLLPYGYVDLWVSTFHALGERILKDQGLEIGLDTNFELLDKVGQWQFIRKHLFDFDLDYWRPLGSPTRFIYALATHFSRLKDENISPEEYLAYAEKIGGAKKGTGTEETEKVAELARAYAQYEKLKADEGFLDFGDLITLPIKLFTKRQKILDSYREKFKYILVDEFQDTNWAQYVLIKMLSAPRNNLTVVGDDDQSIYKFRGAAISNILEFKKDFPDAAEVVMTENYRSKQNILDLSYRFIQLNNPNRLEAHLGSPKGSTGVKISKKLTSTTAGKGIIEHLHTASVEDEVIAVIKKIAELKKKKKKTSWNDFAILVRANDAATPFINALSYHDMPYQYVASRGLFSKPEVMDLISYLKLLDNYHESSALFRVLSMPVYHLRLLDIMRLMEFARKKSISLFEALTKIRSIPNLDPKTVESVVIFIDTMRKHAEAAKTLSVAQVLYQFVNDSGLMRQYTQDVNRQKAEQILNIREFFNYVADFERREHHASVQKFVEQIGLAIESGEEGSLAGLSEEGPDAIKIMTVHAAKGLEFKYVFLVNLVDKRFPTVERKDPIEIPDGLIKETVTGGDIHLEEERRLFYVGMTRAKEGIFFTSAEDYGGARKKKPSQFLYEIGLSKTKAAKPVPKQTSLLDERFQDPLGAKLRKEVPSFEEILPQKFSFTQLKAFETCPYQYRFAHILKVPVRGKGVFSFGKSIHQTLKDFYQLVQTRMKPDLFTVKERVSAKPVVSLDELMDMYERNWIDEWYDSAVHMRERKAQGTKFMKEFYAKHQHALNAPKFLEQPFNIKIGKYTLKGVIDRVDVIAKKKGHDDVHIIDYKTGRVPKNKRDADLEQLLLYAIASREVFGDDPKQLTYYFLDDNQEFTYEPDEKEITQVKERVTKTIGDITTSDFRATPSPYVCKNCDFKDICEFRVL